MNSSTQKIDMKIIAQAGNDEITKVYIAQINGKKLEFVESIQPPLPREKKWVLIISSLYGCPVRCNFCDAGGYYKGKLTKDEILSQVDFLVKNRFGSNVVPVEKFKIQFARVGEPSMNESVLDALEEIPKLYEMKNFIPSLSTVAPQGTDGFFERLIDIKNKLYKGNFQLQFSVHNTDEKARDELIPIKKWSFEQIKEYGVRFYDKGERKITLNFAIKDESAIDKNILLKHFDPEVFLIKITPINPTHKAVKNNMNSVLDKDRLTNGIVKELEDVGYDVILSIGELEENNIGSNCGQYISNLDEDVKKQMESYSYELEGIQ